MTIIRDNQEIVLTEEEMRQTFLEYELILQQQEELRMKEIVRKRLDVYDVPENRKEELAESVASQICHDIRKNGVEEEWALLDDTWYGGFHDYLEAAKTEVAKAHGLTHL